MSNLSDTFPITYVCQEDYFISIIMISAEFLIFEIALLIAADVNKSRIFLRKNIINFICIFRYMKRAKKHNHEFVAGIQKLRQCAIARIYVIILSFLDFT